MNDETLRLLGTWYDNCDPDRGVSEDERRQWYVPLDAWRDARGEVHNLRGAYAADEIFEHIMIASHAPGARSAQLFSGFRGTGKSTELGRVALRLRQSPRFVVLRVDATEFRDMTSAPSREELAILLGAGLAHAAVEALGERVWPRSTQWGELVIEALKRVRVDLEIKPQELGPFELRARLKDGTRFRARLATMADEHPDALKEFLHELVNRVAAACHQQNAQLVLLVDGLEKLRVPSTRVADEYQAMADLLLNEAELLKLPSTHVVYTVPPYLSYLSQGVGHEYRGSVHMLASVKIHGPRPERVENPAGLEALVDLLGRRVDLDQLFGSERDACATRLALASGGHVRDLLLLMRELLPGCFSSGLPVGQDAVDHAIRKMANTRGRFFKETRALLERVATGGDLVEESRADLGELAFAMDQYLVLCYANGENWYDLHPLLWRRFGLGEI